MLVDGITVADLEIFADSDHAGGLVGLFEPTETLAGRKELHKRFLAPESDVARLRSIQDAVRFFAESWSSGLLGRDLVAPVIRYLGSNVDLGSSEQPWRDRARGVWLPLRDRELCTELREGVRASAELLIVSEALARSLIESNPPPLVRSLSARVLELRTEIGDVRPSLGFSQTIRSDRHLRVHRRAELHELAGSLAQLDALRATGVTTRERRWVFPDLLTADRFVLEADGLYHPFLHDPVGNPAHVEEPEPVVFLTGPNMAGKTTYMKAVGVAALLAQIGAGVPARRFGLTPVEVIVTGLNPSDNIRAGLSFFFAEVLRVKTAAQHVAEGRRCLILFDEVFKGTNVRDAIAATEEVITGFAHCQGSGCLFSSHLVELADRFRKLGRVRFVHLEGDVVDGRATYSYRLRPGVSDKRFGLQLLTEAGVPALLQRIMSGRAAPQDRR